MKKLMITILISSIQTVSALAFDLEDYTKAPEVKAEVYFVNDILKKIPTWDIKTQDRVKKYAPMIVAVAQNLDMNPELLLSVAWTESHFNPSAKSNAGALGLMQVKDDTKKYIFKKSPAHKKVFSALLGSYKDVKSLENVIAGGLYIKYLVKKFKGNKDRAIVAYNEGPTGTYRLIKRKFNLNTHNYLIKVSTNLKNLKNAKEKSMVASN